jgi:hypothetical protein
MAGYLTAPEVRANLASPEGIPSRRFEILKSLGYLYNTEHPDCVELTLRALEHREAFGDMNEVLDSLVNEIGLYPYVEAAPTTFVDALRREYHRPLGYDEPIVFHREQASVYRMLMDGKSVVLSAPTSFGKSKIIDAIVASGKYRNIVVVVPTIALIDETRKRLSRFKERYKIVTQVSQEPSEANIFIFTAERSVAYEKLPKIDFFVIDEFYKIGALEEDPARTAALNQAFIRLLKDRATFYMLGPNIKSVPLGLDDRYGFTFFPTDFATVASDAIRIRGGTKSLEKLVELIGTLKEPTLIYCKSPNRVNEVARALLEAGVTEVEEQLRGATDWIGEHYHPDWVLPQALVRGIGIHHGKLPRSLAQFIVRAFNKSDLRVMVCTSTLIEGVNTKAKNVVIFDNYIAKRKLDYFTFNNIRGRSGRMFEHFVGRVFLFHEAPEPMLLPVDFPLFTQAEGTPDSILLELEAKDLKPASKDRVDSILKQTDVSVELIRRHKSVEPDRLIALAIRLRSLPEYQRRLLAWSRTPKFDELAATCEVLWDELTTDRQRHGVFSGRQLAWKVFQLWNEPFLSRVDQELNGTPKYAAKSVDEAVERVLDFERAWANFELPRLLRAFSDVRKEVLGGPGEYGFFAHEVENLFLGPYFMTLEEFGLPTQLTAKLTPYLQDTEGFDAMLAKLKMLNAKSIGLDGFERELFEDFQLGV